MNDIINFTVADKKIRNPGSGIHNPKSSSFSSNKFDLKLLLQERMRQPG